MKSTANIKYLGELRNLCTHIYSGSQIETDAPLDNEGLAARFSPTDLVTVALGSCMLTIMGIKARAMEVDIEKSSCEVYKIMQDSPRRIHEIRLDFVMHCSSEEAKTHTILQNAAMKCPVMLSLHPEVQKTVNFRWNKI